MTLEARAEVERLGALYGEPSPAEGLRIPPQSLEAERAVLGGLMLSGESWPLVSDTLAESDFYRREHQLAWRGIESLANAGKPFDVVTLGEWFESQGLAGEVANGAYLLDLSQAVHSAANIRAHADIVADMSARRKLISAGTDMVNDGFQPEGRELSELLASASQRLAELQPAQRGGLRKASESLQSWFEGFSRRYERGDRLTGMPTPWKGINAVTHGLQPSTLYLFAGRPSMGKSVLGLNLALFAAMRGHTVGLFSLEMSTDDCHNRNIASLSDIPHDWIAAPDPAAEPEDGYSGAMHRAVRDIKGAPLYIDDTPSLTVRQFEARARRMHHRQPLELLVVDHIHDFRIDPKLSRFELGAIAQAGKNLAKEWGIPVVMLAQLNRNVTGRTDKRPTLADLRESGELEQKGDVIGFLHREDYYDSPEHKTHLQGVVEFHFAKGRNIRAGERVNLRNRFDVMRLDDWEGEFPEAPEYQPRKRGFSGSRGMGRASGESA